MYRTVDTCFWTDPKVKALDAPTRLLFLYLFTNPHSHVSGIYYLPEVVGSLETGIPLEGYRRGIDTLSKSLLAHFDPVCEVVFVRNMLKRQAHGANGIKAAAAQLSSLHNSCLIKDFLDAYPEVGRLMPKGYRRGIEGVSKGYRNMEMEMEMEMKEPEANASGFPETAEPSSGTGEPARPEAVLTFPTDGKAKTWDLTADRVAEWQADFPALDVLAECRAALAWVKAHPDRKKTAQGMPRFLVGWLTRSQNRRPGAPTNGTHTNGTPTKADQAKAYAEQWARERGETL